MANRSRGTRQGRTIAPRRLTSWELGPGDCTEVAQSSAGSVFVGQALAIGVDGLTLARIRGRYQAFVTVAGGAVGDGMCGVFGIGLTTTAAVVAGIASVPTPITEQAWDKWLYWTPFQLFVMSVTLADGVNAGIAVIDLEVDTKAMRKLTTEDTIYAAAEVAVEEGAGTNIEHRFDSRALFFLP